MLSLDIFNDHDASVGAYVVEQFLVITDFKSCFNFYYLILELMILVYFDDFDVDFFRLKLF